MIVLIYQIYDQKPKLKIVFKVIYSSFRLIGPPVNQVSRLIGPNCEEQNPIKDNALG